MVSSSAPGIVLGSTEEVDPFVVKGEVEVLAEGVVEEEVQREDANPHGLSFYPTTRL